MRVAIVGVQGIPLQDVKEMTIRINYQISPFLFKPKILCRNLMNNEK